jgi:hypothetical protein
MRASARPPGGRADLERGLDGGGDELARARGTGHGSGLLAHELDQLRGEERQADQVVEDPQHSPPITWSVAKAGPGAWPRYFILTNTE